MRFLFGLVCGALLVVATAYAYDQTRGARGADRPMVNWDVVQAELGAVSAAVRAGVGRLGGAKDGAAQ